MMMFHRGQISISKFTTIIVLVRCDVLASHAGSEEDHHDSTTGFDGNCDEIGRDRVAVDHVELLEPRTGAVNDPLSIVNVEVDGTVDSRVSFILCMCILRSELSRYGIDVALEIMTILELR